MNDKNRNITVRIAVLFSCLIVLAGCMSEDISNVCPGGDAQTSIPLSISNTEEVAVRSIATANERVIEDAYVLVFDAATNKYKAGERVDVSAQLQNNGQQKPVLQTNLNIYKGSKVVVLANTGCTFTTIPLTEGVSTTDDINAAFPSDGWDINRSQPDEGKAMPMSGIMTYGTDTECKMIRSVAKIEIVFSGTLAQNDVTGQFRWDNKNMLFGVYRVLNPTKGLIYSPDYTSGVITPAGIVDGDFHNLMYLESEGLPIPRGTSFYATEYPSATKAKTKAVAADKFDTDRTCYVIWFKDTQSYYRLDLFDKNAGKYLDIRRNCHYKIIINKVKSEGYPSLSEALANPGSNLEYEILVTDENENVVVSNGQYGIVLDCEDLLLYHPENEEFVVAKARFVDAAGTGLPSTNSITASENVTLSGASSLSTTEREIKASMTGTTGTITITVGNITKTIHITRRTGVDAHYEKLTVNGDFSSVRWTRNDNNTDIELNGTTSMNLLFQENVTPINISSLSTKSAEPAFENKYLEGYVSRPTGLMKILVMQLAPEYIGWLGGDSKQTTGDSYYSKRLILESVEERIDLVWSTDLSLTGANSYEDGMYNCTLLMQRANRTDFAAAYYCYMKNDANGNGVIDADEPVTWYLPAKKQQMGVLANYALVTRTFAPECYWASTEASTEGRAWYVGFRITHIDGKLRTNIDYGGRVRCARDIDY